VSGSESRLSVALGEQEEWLSGVRRRQDSLSFVTSASLGATLGDLALAASAIAVPVAHGSPAVPWWWQAYIRRHEAERLAAQQRAREANAVIGDGYAVLSAPVGHGLATHDPDWDTAEWIAAVHVWLRAA
jgi:hypothetical protein